MITQILIASAAALAWLVFPWRNRRGIHSLFLQLSEHKAHDDEDCITVGKLRKRIQHLPDVVQNYIKAVCPTFQLEGDEDDVPFARSLRMEQAGEFLLNGKFIPFTATQEFRTRCEHAGFVWEACMKPNCFPGINVCDAYVNGAGTMRATTFGIPVVNVKSNTPELNQGELMRWAAEAPLFPLALLPPKPTDNGEADTEATTLLWLPAGEGNGNSAILELKHHNTTARLIFHFNPETHLVTSVQAKRPRGLDGKFVLTHWEGFFHNYEIHGGLLVPTRMECGWKLGDGAPLEIYFKGTNSHLIYLTNHPKRVFDMKKEHVD